MIQLTESQKKAIDGITAEMFHPTRGGTISLVGGGGVGKTTSIFELINQLENEHRLKVLICAPTHKACNVLRETQTHFDNSTPVITLASALGFRQLPVDGKRTFKVRGANKLEGVDVIIVDEASQVGREANKELQKQALAQNIHIIGLGDDCQLPPVKEYESPLFANGRLFELTEVIRYTGDVLVMATDLRKHIKSGSKDKYDIREHIPENSKDIVSYSSRKAFLEAAIAQVNPDDPDHMKILAWRNIQVQEYNRKVHEALHGLDAPEYLVGDFVLPQAPILEDKAIVANTDDPCIVLDLSHGAEDLLGMGKVLLNTNVFTVKNIRTSEQFTFESVTNADTELYRQAMQEIVQMCRAGDVHWSEFYEIDERLVEVRHPYSCTAHKAQGSTFQQNFMDIPDIMRCRQPYVRDRLVYTGITRANKLGILL